MAKPKSGGLGRGLDSLFGDSAINLEPVSIIEPKEVPAKKPSAKTAAKPKKESPAASGESVVYVALGDIKPNSKQPRTVFKEEALEELAASIKEHGVIQPVLLRPAAKGYELVAGERRWRAARKAGLKTIPAIVRDLDERQNMFYALIENMQRENLNSIEEAKAIKELMDSYSLNQEEAAKAVGKSRPYVANSMRLLKLPQEVQEMVENGNLSAGHARAIAGLSGEELQIEAAEKAVKLGWTVRQIEGYTGEKKQKRTPKKKQSNKNKEFAAVEEKLSEKLGTKVRIIGTEKSGKLQLDYYSREELERLIEVLGDE